MSTRPPTPEDLEKIKKIAEGTWSPPKKPEKK